MTSPDERAERIANDIYAWAKRFADEHEQRPTGRITLTDLESDIQDFCNAAGPDKVLEILGVMGRPNSQTNVPAGTSPSVAHRPETIVGDLGFQISLETGVGTLSRPFVAKRDPGSKVFRWPNFCGFESDAINALLTEAARMSQGKDNPMLDCDRWEGSTSWEVMQALCAEIEHLTISWGERPAKREEARAASKREMHQLIDEANPGAPMARLLRLIVETL